MHLPGVGPDVTSVSLWFCDSLGPEPWGARRLFGAFVAFTESSPPQPTPDRNVLHQYEMRKNSSKEMGRTATFKKCYFSFSSHSYLLVICEVDKKQKDSRVANEILGVKK